LIDKITDHSGGELFIRLIHAEIEQAKEIEKQQIIEAFTHEDNTTWNKELRTKAAEQYYDEKYGS